MKRILITGKSSYIGNELEKWLNQFDGEYRIDKISLRDNRWRKIDLSIYDSVVHLAGIAHASRNPKLKDEYYKINRDLTIDLAKKAKQEGVNQFIFMSSIIVYGNSVELINKDTIPKPDNFYGESKLQAEQGIQQLENPEFKVVIVRPPMIYGAGAKGNISKLLKLSRITPIFPQFNNERSMLYVNNLNQFLHYLIKDRERGMFFPQNEVYSNTTEVIKILSLAQNKKVFLTKIFNPLINNLKNKVEFINKLFGNLKYSKEMSLYDKNYIVKDMRESFMDMCRGNQENSMDVLLVTDNGLETVGGEQESTKIIINNLNSKYNVGVIQPGVFDNEYKNAKIYNLTSKTRLKHVIKNPISLLKYLHSIRKIVKTERPKIIHTQAQVSFFIIALYIKLNLIPNNIHFIHTERGLYTKYNLAIKQIFKFFIKELTSMVTTTYFNKSYWEKPINKISNNIDMDVIENTAGNIFEEYNEKKDRPFDDKLVIGFAGRYCDWKNWPLAVEIIEKANANLGQHLEVKMAVGCLDTASKEKTEKMFAHVRSILGQRFEGKINVDLKTMDQFYYDIDLFILTSNYNTESFGRTLVEAMSRNNAVLTTDSGGSVEVVNNKELVCNTADQFIDKIIKYYRDKNSLKLEKARNLKYVNKKYSLENNVSKHLQLYSKYLNE